jgi:hypothetical protein
MRSFTLWANAIVADESIRAESLLGKGIMTGDDSEVPAPANEHQAPRQRAWRSRAAGASRSRAAVPAPRRPERDDSDLAAAHAR